MAEHGFEGAKGNFDENEGMKRSSQELSRTAI
jgi:hypothetical protein